MESENMKQEEQLKELMDKMPELKDIQVEDLIKNVVHTIQKNCRTLGAAVVLIVCSNNFYDIFNLLPFNGIG